MVKPQHGWPGPSKYTGAVHVTLTTEAPDGIPSDVAADVADYASAKAAADALVLEGDKVILIRAEREV
jgi:hypothetical protein